jgi:hypothetical protein
MPAEESYVDSAQVRLDDLRLSAPNGIDFGAEHVQWALATDMPGNISGIDYSQRPADGGQYLV